MKSALARLAVVLTALSAAVVISAVTDPRFQEHAERELATEAEISQSIYQAQLRNQ